MTSRSLSGMRLLAHLFLILLLMIINIVRAQIPVNDTIVLKEIEIVDSRPSGEEISPVPLQIITRNELKQRAMLSAADAVKTFSGVVLRDYGGIGGLKTVKVRSLGSNHTAVFRDGVQISDIQTGQIDLGRFQLHGVDEVVLYQGHANLVGLPARHYASAAALHIRSFYPNLHERTTSGSAGIALGSFGQNHATFDLHHRAGRNVTTGISAERLAAHGQYKYRIFAGNLYDSVALRENTDIETYNLHGYLFVHRPNGSKFQVRTWIQDSKRGLPGAVVLYQQGADERLTNRDFCINLRYIGRPSARLSIQSNITFTENHLNYFDPTYPNLAGKIDQLYVQREFYGSHATAIHSKGNFDFGLSQDLIINTLTTNLTGQKQARRSTSLTVASSQWMYNRWSLQASMLATVIDEKEFAASKIPLRTRLSPSVSAGFRISDTPTLRLRLSYSEVFRMPTFNDLYYTLSGNRNLLPETARLWNIGMVASYKLNDKVRFLIGVDIYRNSVTDKIVAVPTRNLFVWSMRNLGMVSITGAEFKLDATIKICQRFHSRLSINYSRQEARDITSPDLPVYGHQIAYIPFETLSASATLSNSRLSFGYYMLFNGFRYALGENIAANFLPGWYVSDVSAKYQFEIATVDVILRGAINNLFDHQYEVIRSFPMPGRSVNLSVLFQY